MYEIVIDKWIGRFGNNLIQLSHAIHLARETQSVLSYPTHSLIKNTIFDFRADKNNTLTNSVELTQREKLTYNFFDDIQNISQWHEVAHTFDSYEIPQLYILPLIPYAPMNVDFDIVVHLRGGDVFKSPHYENVLIMRMNILSYPLHLTMYNLPLPIFIRFFQ